MTVLLLSHQWKAFWRSRSTGKSIAIQIFTGFITLYLLSIALFLGFSLPTFLMKFFPGQNIVTVFCGFILYYFALDIVFRFLLQDLPALAVQPYLAQNIKRRELVHFLNLRSLFSFFNLLPLVLFVPFSISAIGHQYGSYTALAFVVVILSLCIFNHFIILFIKRKTGISIGWLVGFFALVVLFILGDYFSVFSLTKISAVLFIALLKMPWLCGVAVLLAIAAFYNNSIFLNNNLYLEEMTKAGRQKESAEYTWLQKFGNTGDLFAIDLKLILRNKRPRSLLLLSFIFLLYGFILYKPGYLNKDQLGFVLLGGIFITGIFIVNYGQFLFAWQSTHFDGLMASNIYIKTYIQSKFVLLTAFSTVALLLSLSYGFINWKIIPIQIAAYFFNVGINIVITAYFATRSYKGLDLSKGATFNYQGIGAVQWLYSLFILIAGAAIYLPFALLINSWAGIIAIGTLGLISFLLRDWWIDILTKQFIQRKYQILQGFREK
jgi:hypothetical protein